MFKLLFLFLIAVLLYNILKSIKLRSHGELKGKKKRAKRRQVGFDRSQVIDAEFKEVEEEAEAEK